MSVFIKMSQLYAPTLKESPAEAELASHKLLLRAGMIRKSAAGVYSFLPLGWRSLHKIENIVREEMDGIGAQEICMTVMQPAEIWHESGRWDDYGPELMRLKDRHDREFCLGPTHEELITTLIRGELRSYKELPVSMYQIQVKFRDEIRPRFGLLRGREFIMKDAYSFHDSQESLNEHYEDMSGAYGRICDRLGLEYYPVMADGGQIGGSVTTEFMALADAGENEIVYCDCGFAGNTEVAPADVPASTLPAADLAEVATPSASSIADVAAVLKVGEDDVVKAIAAKDAKGTILMLLLPGGHELNEIKAEHAFDGFMLLNDGEIEAAGLVKGFLGPVGVPANVKVIADNSLRDRANWIVGANKVDAHLTGAALDRDITVHDWADLNTAKAGDLCPECRNVLKSARGIEVSQVFQLGDKYSTALNATYSDVDGDEQPFLMGCYGVGISRSLAAVIEQHNDERGITWPISIAPAEVAVIPLTVGDEDIFPVAEKIARGLYDVGVEVVFDDREERPGVKFADADLIGWPVQVVVGKKGLENGIAEVKIRSTGERMEFPLDEVAQTVADLVIEERAGYAYKGK